MIPRVVIVSFGAEPEADFGATLFLRTLRVGFPTADVTVRDNATIEPIRRALQAACAADRWAYERAEVALEHASILEEEVASAAEVDEQSGEDRPLVFVDPDVVFWSSVEAWAFPESTLMAGRLMPLSELFGALSEPRLHTSLLWIPSPRRLWAEIEEMRGRLWDWKPFAPSLSVTRGVARHLDTAANLYLTLSSLRPGSCVPFRPEHLDCYDHLFSGTAPTLLRQGARDDWASDVVEHTRLAKENLRALRGAWRDQEARLQESSRRALDLVEGGTPLGRMPGRAALRRWAREDEEATSFLLAFTAWSHTLDDLADGDKNGPLGRAALAAENTAQAMAVLESPFYRRHETTLRQALRTAGLQWAVSDELGRSLVRERRLVGHVWRCAAESVVIAVADLVGGWEHARRVTREIADYHHHGRDGFDEWEKTP